MDFFDEPGERHGFSLDQVVIGFLDYLGHDQVDVQFIELGELGMGHVAGSQGEQVFVPDPVGFVGDLAETILETLSVPAAGGKENKETTITPTRRRNNGSN